MSTQKNTMSSSTDIQAEPERDNTAQNEPNIYVVLGNKLFSVCQSIRQQSSYFARKISQGHKAIVIQNQPGQNLKEAEEALEVILKFLQGQTITLSRDRSTVTLLRLSKQLEIPTLLAQIFADVENNMKQYCIFVAYEISVQGNNESLINKCNQQLAAKEYNQMFQHKNELFQLSQQTVAKIIQGYQKWLDSRDESVPTQKIAKLLQQYYKGQQKQINIEQILASIPFQSSDDEFSIKEGKLKISKLNKSDLSQISDMSDKFPSQGNISSTSIKSPLQQKNKKVNELFNEYDFVTSPVYTLDQIEQKPTSFESWGNIQDDKFMTIMESNQISEKGTEEEDDENQEFKESPLSSNKIQKKSTLPSVPEINKHFVV